MNGNPLVNVDPLGLQSSCGPGMIYCNEAINAARMARGASPILVPAPVSNEAAHPEEEEALNATCDDAAWAIPKLKELIESRKRQYKASGGGRIDINPTGPGHKKRIKKLEDKLKWLEECPKNCP